MNDLSYLQDELSKYEEAYDELKQHYYQIQHGTSDECLEEQDEVLDEMRNLEMAHDLTKTLISNLMRVILCEHDLGDLSVSDDCSISIPEGVPLHPSAVGLASRIIDAETNGKPVMAGWEETA